jgi:C4-dicarboxylate-specific signal transduction histidine kinase
MLGGLSCSIAHELSQPLSAILSNAQAALRLMAHEQPDLAQVRDILVDIVEDDRRAGQIIHGLRSLLGGGEIHCEPLDLNETVLGALSLVRSELLNKGVSLNVELARDLPRVSGDGVQLQQVLLNLVMNACESMIGEAPEHRQLWVATGHRPDGRAEVLVIDHGCGIPAGGLERVFEPFFTTRKEGIGLGLALCRQIVCAQGGSLWAQHNAGRGSRFCFTVPSVAGSCA